MSDEHRQDPRHRTFKGGSILFGSMASVDCLIRNLSQTGACLELKEFVGVPDNFTLLIRPELLKRSCEVAWRSELKIGVMFK